MSQVSGSVAKGPNKRSSKASAPAPPSSEYGLGGGGGGGGQKKSDIDQAASFVDTLFV